MGFTNLEKIEAVLWMHGPLTATEVSHFIVGLSRASASAVIHKAMAAGYLVEVDHKGPRGGRRVNINVDSPRREEKQDLWDELSSVLTDEKQYRALLAKEAKERQDRKREERRQKQLAAERAEQAAKKKAIQESKNILNKKPHLDATPLEGEFDFGF